jgi:hypothetical protein
MDPHLLLGVPHDCDRRQAQIAFRAKVSSAHPDRGGDEAEFIRICAAYRMILAKLEASADSARPTASKNGFRAPRTGSRSTDASSVDWIVELTARLDAAQTGPAGGACVDPSPSFWTLVLIWALVCTMFFICKFLSLFLVDQKPDPAPAFNSRADDDPRSICRPAAAGTWRTAINGTDGGTRGCRRTVGGICPGCDRSLGTIDARASGPENPAKFAQQRPVYLSVARAG